MKRVIALAGFLVLGTAHAEVFKCQKPSGGIQYQSEPCATGPSEQVQIEPSDPEKIKAAQEKLAESLKQQAARDAAADAAAQKERDIAAKEAIAAGMNSRTNTTNSTSMPQYRAPQPVTPNYYGTPVMTPGLPQDSKNTMPSSQ